MAKQRTAKKSGPWSYALPSLVATLPWALLATQGDQAEAGPGSILYVHRGVNASSIYDYGWHFDEASPDEEFGVRDFNFPNDDGAGAALWAKTPSTDPYFPVRYKLYPNGDNLCEVKASLQYFDGANVHDIPQTELHYIHLNNRPSGTIYTGWADQPNQWLGAGIGNIGACGTSFAHLHQSADLTDYSSGAYMNRITKGGDTCWANSETWECPSTYVLHDPASACPPGAPLFATGGVSGNISQYTCEEWSSESRNAKHLTFQVSY